MSQTLAQQLQKLLDSADIQINGNRPFDVKVHDERFYSKVFAEGPLGIGESYMDGLWDCDQLDELFSRILRAQINTKIKPKGMLSTVLKAKLLNQQNKKKSTTVAKIHYDLGNDLYSKMLDKRMQYTCAYWLNAKNLDEAQEHKLELICKKIKLQKGDRVLDLGCGWGGFAKYAAEKYGCHVTAVNISTEQVKYARESCKDLPVEIIQSDYRDAKGNFDKVVSVGLCEHVGPKNYRTFMEVAYNCLNDQGLFLLHTIGGNQPGPMDPWFDKYIFPNSILPTISQLSQAAEGLFIIEDLHNFGPDYDKTLIAWFANFNKHWPNLEKQYGERFYRMWKYYLLSCAGLFRSRSAELWQFVLSKNGIIGGYKSVR